MKHDIVHVLYIMKHDIVHVLYIMKHNIKQCVQFSPW